MRGKLYIDGGARPTNPGYAGFACVVENVEQGNKHELSRFIGKKTNNQAELYALIVGVKFAYFCGFRELDIFTDSKLVVNSVSGDWLVKKDTIKLLVQEARDILQQYFKDAAEFHLIPRAENTYADRLCTDAIYAGMNRNPFTPARIKESRPAGKEIDPFSRMDRGKFPPNPSAILPSNPS